VLDAFGSQGISGRDDSLFDFGLDLHRFFATARKPGTLVPGGIAAP
jgi:hypothetical protein